MNYFIIDKKICITKNDLKVRELLELINENYENKFILRTKKLQKYLSEKRNLTSFQNKKKLDLYFARNNENK